MRKLALLVTVFAVAALLSFGCDGLKTSDEYAGPTTTIIFRAEANASSAVIDKDGVVLFDVGAGSTGCGGSDGIDSISDDVRKYLNILI